ncbi:hypothetical protein K3495_g7405 [Podosphaera aphanis]|nr:hypothetical protein K3495_g7405 [Podosphaera aphanis]
MSQELQVRARVLALTVPFFDGVSMGAHKWLLLLKQDLEKANLDPRQHPSQWTKAIYSRSIGEADVWMHSTPHISRIVQDTDTTTAEQALLLVSELKARFPGPISHDPGLQNPVWEAQNLQQSPSEDLNTYIRRVRTFYQRIGARSGREYDDLQQGFIAVIIQNFIRGLTDVNLKIEAIRQGAPTSLTLDSAMEKVLNAQSTLQQLAKMEHQSRINDTILQRWPASHGVETSVVAVSAFSNQLPEYQAPAYVIPHAPQPIAPRTAPPAQNRDPPSASRTQPNPAGVLPQARPSSQRYVPPAQRNMGKRGAYGGPPRSQGVNSSGSQPKLARYVDPEFDNATSTCAAVNGSHIVSRPYFRCGSGDGHGAENCRNAPLSRNEQNFLWNRFVEHWNRNLECPTPEPQATLPLPSDPPYLQPRVEELHEPEEDYSGLQEQSFEEYSGMQESSSSRMGSHMVEISLGQAEHRGKEVLSKADSELLSTQISNAVVYPAESATEWDLFQLNEELEALSMEVPEDEEPLRSSKEIISGLFPEVMEVTGENPRKRTRLDVPGLLNSEDEDSQGIEGRKFAKGKLGKAPANSRHLKNIAARKGESPVDIGCAC